jgi:hypothetical protein
MPATYEPIATTTLGSATATVTFNSIPGTYTDLILITSTASDLASGSEHILCRFNSDSGTNYSATYLYGTGSSALSGRNSNSTGAFIGRQEQTELGTGITHIQNYANTTTNKTVLSRGGLAGQITIAYVSLWRSTSAITRIDLTPNGATNFDAGSTFTLYGVKAA